MSEIGIVIVHWRDFEGTVDTLNKLLRWTIIQPQIFLVQNESTSDAFKAFEDERITKIYSRINLGYGGGNNLGISASIKGGCLFTLLLNTDADIVEEELLKLSRYLEKKKEVFSVGPVLREHTTGETKVYIGGRNIAKFNNTRIEQGAVNFTEEAIEVFYNIGAIILLNNEHLKKIGLLDTDYFFSGEVADLSYRAKKEGLIAVTLLSAIGDHFVEESTLRATLYKYYSLRNRFMFIRKNKAYKKYLWKWWKIIIKNFIYALLTVNVKQIRMLSICMFDIFFGVKGNQNHKFL